MWMPIAAPLFASSLILVADRVPTFDVRPSCRGAAVQSVPGADESICARKEQDARNQLVKQWGDFNSGDKAYCVPLASTGGRPTYTELLTCLEIAKAVRVVRAEEAKKNQPAGGTRRQR